jgi:hypothetical protein
LRLKRYPYQEQPCLLVLGIFLAFILLFYITGFSTCDLENSVALSTLPLGVKCYANSDENKLKILKENDGKLGIYQ